MNSLKKKDPRGAIAKGYEPTDFKVSAVTRYALYLLLGVIGVQVILMFFYGLFNRGYPNPKPKRLAWTGQPVPPVEIREVENESGQEWKEMQKANQARLNSYGWVNSKEGIARVPIQRAIEMYLQKERGT